MRRVRASQQQVLPSCAFAFVGVQVWVVGVRFDWKS